MLGDIVVRLYDETPIHRDNFIKLVKEGYYDGTLFHRVIKDFMIQGGDPDSKGAPAGKMLGVGGPDYTLEAEIKDGLFHKRGALAAARQGDEVNPDRNRPWWPSCWWYRDENDIGGLGMMKPLIDAHTHTVASGHAYSSLQEMAKAASEKGLQVLGIYELLARKVLRLSGNIG